MSTEVSWWRQEKQNLKVEGVAFNGKKLKSVKAKALTSRWRFLFNYIEQYLPLRHEGAVEGAPPTKLSIIKVGHV
jgi:hypothetical protein